MKSPLSPRQLGLLRRALASGVSTDDESDLRDLAVLARAGLVREFGGAYSATDAGRRYGKCVFEDPRSE